MGQKMPLKKWVGFACLGLMASTGLATAEDTKLPPGVKMQDLGTRQAVTLTTSKVIFGNMDDSENGLLLTVDNT